MGATVEVNRQRVARIVTAVVATVVVVGATGCTSEPARESDAAVREELDDMAGRMQARATDLVTEVDGALPDGAEVVAQRAGHDCREGQHNWKIDDPFDLECTVRHHVVVGVSGDVAAAPFMGDMVELHDALVVAGLEPRRQGLPDLDGYTEDFGNTSVRRTDLDGDPVDYGPQHLPDPDYVASDEVVVSVGFTGAQDTHMADETRWTLTDGTEVLGAEMVRGLTGHTYALVFSTRVRQTW